MPELDAPPVSKECFEAVDARNRGARMGLNISFSLMIGFVVAFAFKDMLAGHNIENGQLYLWPLFSSMIFLAYRRLFRWEIEQIVARVGSEAPIRSKIISISRGRYGIRPSHGPLFDTFFVCQPQDGEKNSIRLIVRGDFTKTVAVGETLLFFWNERPLQVHYPMAYRPEYRCLLREDKHPGLTAYADATAIHKFPDANVVAVHFLNEDGKAMT